MALLIAATAEGDRQSFAELYRLSGARLFGISMRILRKSDLAEEAVQDTYLQVWRNAGSYRSEKGSPMAWLVGIVRFRSLDRLRRETADRSLGEDTATEEVASTATDPFEATSQSDELRALLACMKKLETNQRESLLLAYYEGCTHQELAHRLNAPLGTVKSWIRRGLLSVRECLES